MRLGSDDVQLLNTTSSTPSSASRNNSNAIECQVCNIDLTNISFKDRNIHYNEHFNDESEPSGGATSRRQSFSPISSSSKPPSKLKAVLQLRDVPLSSKNIFWHPAQATYPPENFTPGLIPLLKKALITSHSRGSTLRAWLCADVATHIQVEFWDRGWGCGYRNFLMACAALIAQTEQPLYYPQLDHPLPPGVHNLQRWIHDAWEDGYDEVGAQQLSHKLIDTTKWIGTGELSVAFASRGIPANLVDFVLPHKDPAALLNWIERYFSQESSPKPSDLNSALFGASPVVVTSKMPLILQHAGHSRTVVGFEKYQNGVNLLIFDPSKRVPSEIRQTALSTAHPAHLPSSHHDFGSKRVSNIVNHILHPISGHNGKRPASEVTDRGDGVAAKRARSGSPKDVVVVDVDEAEEISSASNVRKPISLGHNQVDPNSVLKLFRVRASSLKQDKFQILYFPLTPPLDESQKRARKVVTSVKIGQKSGFR